MFITINYWEEKMHHNIFDKKREVSSKNGENAFVCFLQKSGLYDVMDITEENINDLIELLDGQVRISSYCTECREERVFTIKPSTYFTEVGDSLVERKLADEVQFLQNNIYGSDSDYRKEKGGEWKWKNWQIDEITRVLVFKFTCSMNDEHHLDFIVLTNNGSFRKIGQFPSVADLTFPELEVYKKVIDADDRKELGRAIGLFASGIGAGSYVYLRRIFERLLVRAKALAGTAIDDEEFGRARVDEKITLLANYLPQTLTSNTTLYGILSKGIHELSEEKCIEYFPVVKECIFMILDEWEEQRRKKEKEKAISSALSKITSQIT